MSKPFEGQSTNHYLEGPFRLVPGYDGLLRMTTQLLAEKVPESGKILVLGAGGGLEIRAMAEEQFTWTFEGIDPSQDMIDLAVQTIANHSDRVRLTTGYIDSATAGPFDGATCILTMHFVPSEERLNTLQEIRKRLSPGAPFVMAHISFSQEEPERSRWVARHVTYGGTPTDKLEAAMEAISTKLTILSPDEEESLLREAGFNDVSLFYAGLSFRGWIAYAD